MSLPCIIDEHVIMFFIEIENQSFITCVGEPGF